MPVLSVEKITILGNSFRHYPAILLEQCAAFLFGEKLKKGFPLQFTHGMAENIGCPAVYIPVFNVINLAFSVSYRGKGYKTIAGVFEDILEHLSPAQLFRSCLYFLSSFFS